jgi:hypothetical protein
MSRAPRAHRCVDYVPHVSLNVRTRRGGPRTGDVRAGAVLGALLLLISGLAACTKDREGTPLIEDYVTGVQAVDASGAKGTVVDQQLEPGSDDGPVAQLAGSATVVNGGSVQQMVASPQQFTKVRIGLEPVNVNPATTGGAAATTRGSSGVPVQGYREISLAQPATTVNLVVTLAQHLPGDGFDFFVGLVNASGKQGKLARQQVNVIQVGTGDVQISVSWDADSDVDLHVVDPKGDEVYYNNSPVPSGGDLDLDSNADCDIDHKRNENVTWARAPAGRYTVRVDLYKSCGVASTNYVVTVQVVGQPTKTFTGSFGNAGDLGGLGDGHEVVAFDVAGTPT